MKFFILEQDKCAKLLSTRTQKTYSKCIEGTKIDVAFIDYEIYFKLNGLLTFDRGTNHGYLIYRALRDTFANVFKIGRDFFVQAKYLYTYVNHFVGRPYVSEEKQSGLVKALLKNPSLFELHIEYSDFDKKILQNAIKYTSDAFTEVDENTKGFSFYLYYSLHKEKIKEYSNKWRKEHKEYLKEYSNKWKKEHKEYLKEYYKQLYLKKKAQKAAKEAELTSSGVVAKNINTPVNVVKNPGGTISVPFDPILLGIDGGTISVSNANVVIGSNNIIINSSDDTDTPTISNKTDFNKMEEKVRISVFEKLKKFFKGLK